MFPAPFPYDILVQIVSWVPRTAWTTLCLVCRDFHHLAAPRLYRVAFFEPVDAKKCHEFLKVVSLSRHLGSFVSHLTIRLVPDEALAIFVPALRNMPNLHHFHCSNLEAIFLHNPSVFDVITSLAGLRSFDANWSDEYDLNDFNDILDRLPPLHSISIDAYSNSIEAFGRLLLRSHDTLRSLGTYYWELETFLQSQGRGVVWPQMSELKVYDLQSPAPVFKAFANLEALHARCEPVSWEVIHSLGDPSILPRLRQLSIVASPRPETVDRARRPRRLSHLYVDVHPGDWSASASLQDFMAAFSWQHLQSLQFLAYHCAMLDYILDILPTVLDGCTQLTFLALSYESLFELPDPNPLFHMLDALNGLPGSVRLPTLRYLVLCANSVDANQAEVASHMEIVEGKAGPLFERLSGLRELQCQCMETEIFWRRPWASHGPSSGGERLLGHVDKLPTELPDVVQFLES